jgi:hypothetical protein
MKRSSLFCMAGGRFLAALLIATLSAAGVTGSAHADTVTFAQFTQRTVSDQDFIYTNNGTGASLNSISGGIPISLLITNGFAPNLAGVESAHLFLTTSTTAGTISPVSPNVLTSEHFSGLGNSLQIILDTPVNGKNDFLTVNFSDAVLSGQLTSTEASLKASDSGNAAKVSFSSEFINFSNADEHGFSLSFSSVNSTNGSGALQAAMDGFFNAFTTSGTGTFDVSFATPAPEPPSLLLAGVGLCGVFLIRGIRRLF